MLLGALFGAGDGFYGRHLVKCDSFTVFNYFYSCYISILDNKLGLLTNESVCKKIVRRIVFSVCLFIFVF